MPSWPVTLPAKPRIGSYGYVRVPNVVAFQPDVGPTLRRRRQTATGVDLQAAMVLTEAKKVILDDFFETDCADGALSFTMTDWDLGTTKTFTWRAAPSYQLHKAGTIWVVTLVLRREP